MHSYIPKQPSSKIVLKFGPLEVVILTWVVVLYVYVYIHLGIGACEVWKGCVGYPGTRVTSNCETPIWALRTEFRSSGIAASTLYH